MAKIAYQSTKLGADRLALIDKCNDIIAEYQADGLLLTLRQLYYQLVSHDIIANKTTEYKRLGDVVNTARLCGLMDWSAIEDRTRELVVSAHWDGPEDILSACAVDTCGTTPSAPAARPSTATAAGPRTGPCTSARGTGTSA